MDERSISSIPPKQQRKNTAILTSSCCCSFSPKDQRGRRASTKDHSWPTLVSACGLRLKASCIWNAQVDRTMKLGLLATVQTPPCTPPRRCPHASANWDLKGCVMISAARPSTCTEPRAACDGKMFRSYGTWWKTESMPGGSKNPYAMAASVCA